MIRVEPLETMVAYATMWPDEPGPHESADGFTVFPAHSDAFPDSEAPVVCMEYGRLIALLEEARNLTETE